MKVKLDTECLKFVDPRICRVRNARLSIEAFAMTVRPDDPFILIGDTIYAMTEQEFYAYRVVPSGAFLGEKAFHYVLDTVDPCIFTKADADFVTRVRKELPTCPACRYKRYKDAIHNLIKRYKINIPGEFLEAGVADVPVYPDTTDIVLPKVPLLTRLSSGVSAPVRKGCIDCVEKHVSQAYVLSRECRIGYPEYVYMVSGHLAEAIDELPDNAGALRSTLEFCLARTNKYSSPFVPLSLIAPVIYTTRASMFMSHTEAGNPEELEDADSVDMTLELTDGMLDELSELDTALRDKVTAYCNEIVDFPTRLENHSDTRLAWEGNMAQLADVLAFAAPRTANMLRDRRLVFTANPALMKEAGLDVTDVLEAVNRERP